MTSTAGVGASTPALRPTDESDFMNEMQRVLVVDDEPIVREVVCSYLRRDGFETVEAADGVAALAAVEDPSLSIVLLDVMIPGPDGLEVCRRVRAISDLPVILLTARGEEADRIVGLELGADDYVTKPFSPANSWRG